LIVQFGEAFNSRVLVAMPGQQLMHPDHQFCAAQAVLQGFEA